MPQLSRQLCRNPLVLTGGSVILLLTLLALLAPWLTPYEPAQINLSSILQAPNATHWLGTDQLGRDVLTRLLYGAQVSLSVGLIAVGLATVLGLLVGALAGFYGGRTDAFLMRLTDVMLCFPSFFLILAVIAFLEPSLTNIMIVIGLTSWMGVSRLIRAEFLRLRGTEFVLAAQSLGVSSAGLIRKHLLPNSLAPVYVTVTLGVAGAILVESGLSFLGIGVQPPTPSWGNLLTAGKETVEVAWWLVLYPGVAILITVLAFNLLGEGLRDVLDPRLQKR
jgi:peptide/nickel transport system permease protein